MTPIDRAIDAAGGLSGLARILNLKPAVVGNWRLREQIPAERVLAIEQATGVSRHELRPDVFGPAPSKSRAA